MKPSQHRFWFLRKSGVLIVLCGVIALYSCSSAIKLNYVNWDIEFTKGASEQDKAVAMDSIRRYILISLSEQGYTGYSIKQLTFKSRDFTSRDRTSIGVTISFTNESQDSYAPPKPGNGPKQPNLHSPGVPAIHNVSIKPSIPE